MLANSGYNLFAGLICPSLYPDGTYMNPTTKPTASDEKIAADPLISLVLLAAIHHPKDAPELLKPLGVNQAELVKFAADNAETVDTIRKMAIAGALLDRDTFARLIRVRVGVKLIETQDPRQLAALVSAAAKLPGWVFGEVEPQVSQPGNGVRQKGVPNNGIYHNGVFLDQQNGLPDITAIGMKETIAEAKRLIDEMEHSGEVQLG